MVDSGNYVFKSSKNPLISTRKGFNAPFKLKLHIIECLTFVCYCYFRYPWCKSTSLCCRSITIVRGAARRVRTIRQPRSSRPGLSGQPELQPLRLRKQPKLRLQPSRPRIRPAGVRPARIRAKQPEPRVPSEQRLRFWLK